MTTGRAFAIVPAAGFSLRMGAPKLLLPWKGTSIIGHTLQAWTRSQVTKTIVILRADDELLAAACKNWPVDIVRPSTNPVDMKQSIQFALLHAESAYDAAPPDRWLVAPADMPHLSGQVINSLVSSGLDLESIVLPRFGDRIGHPVSFPWRFRKHLFELKEDEGVNRIIETESVFHVDLTSDVLFDDLDTPEDYSRLLGNGVH
ncbi:MAG: nucleotidyltransferase family protein [Pirellula sp.]